MTIVFFVSSKRACFSWHGSKSTLGLAAGAQQCCRMRMIHDPAAFSVGRIERIGASISA
jgi:hypothetical protein